MITLKVGLGSCGVSAGADKTLELLRAETEKRHLNVRLLETGCNGMCYREPLVEIIEENGNTFLYGEISSARVEKLVQQHLVEKKPVQEWLLISPELNVDQSFFNKQRRIVLRNCGIIDPDSVEDYEKNGGYQAIRKVLKEYQPEDVIEMIKKSGLRGRGGGGFPTGLKWQLCRREQADKKFIICNADEGDPGAFMDRSVLESDPHSVLEGMMIAAYAIGSDEGYIYVRAEYPRAVKRLRLALKLLEERGYLGKKIFGSKMNFFLHIKEGAGAFVCGEETALMASIEGKRGMPRFRPPFPAQKGLWGYPTNINNVETFANVAWIVLNGPEAFAAMGTENSKGSKVFALAGRIKRGGLVEVPMGITINEIVYEIGGGIRDDKKFKAVQMGGPSGGCIPATMGNLQIDYQQINQTGAIMGSGGMVVMDETTCMVEMAKFFLRFTQDESCGKCTFCRLGTKRMLEILERITEGKGREEDLEALETLSYQIKTASLCGLGQTAPNPVLTTLRYFRQEYEAHVFQKKCPAHSCQALIRFSILAEKCTGCTLCARVCPTQAISGEAKKTHRIDQEKCIRCGKCFESCRFAAILKD